MTFDAIVDAVLAQGGFDVARSVAEGWVNEKHREAVAGSQWLTSRVDLGTTVADVSDYALPETVVEIEGLYLDNDAGEPGDWRRVTTTEMWQINSGSLSIAGSGGVFSAKYGTAGERLVELYPAPTVTGVSIVTLASVLPATMASGASPSIPEDMHGDLLDGAISLGLVRMDERSDAAAAPDAKFQRMVIRLTRRKIARVGSGASRPRVMGFDA